MAEQTCVVCCDTKLTQRTRSRCRLCDFECCRTCLKQYLLSLNDDPQCMNCRKGMTHEMLLECLPRTWVDKEYRRHREDVLLDQQKALIPATQEAVELRRLQRASSERLLALQELKYMYRRKLRDVQLRIDAEYRTLRTELAHRPARRQFVMKCAKEGCRGFVSEQYRCAVCEGETCSRCHVFKEPGDAAEHVCDPDTVATVALLRRDSKRCPQCAVWVHRYQGCSQMFCTNCKTMFDYVTLRRIGQSEAFHNPHLTEYLASQAAGGAPGRALGDIPCGGMPHQTTLIGFLRAHAHEDQLLARRVMHLHRAIVDLEHVWLPRYRDQVQDLEELRVQFCLNDFGEDEWKKRLQREERKRAKRHEIFLVLEMMVHAGGDLFRQMLVPESRGATVGRPLAHVGAIYAEVCALVDHANAQLRKVSKGFGCIVPHVEWNDRVNVVVRATTLK